MYPESCEYLWWVSVSAKLRVMTRGEIETVNEDDVGCHVEFAQAGQTAWTFLNARTEVRKQWAPELAPRTAPNNF